MKNFYWNVDWIFLFDSIFWLNNILHLYIVFFASEHAITWSILMMIFLKLYINPYYYPLESDFHEASDFVCLSTAISPALEQYMVHSR